jgi:lysozyme family protein
MARIENLIPFILYYEAGGAKSCFKRVSNGKGQKIVYDTSLLTLEKQFDECRKRGLANDPDDKGGLTMCGVTYSTYAAYCNRKKIQATESGLLNLTYKVWYDILKTMFWDRWKADSIIDQSVANILVDWVWASGITGIKRPQRILGVEADGIVGPKTLSAVNRLDPQKLFDALHNDRLKHFDEICQKTPSQKKFLKGWRRRVNAISYGELLYQ